jgi:uncharacterized protein
MRLLLPPSETKAPGGDGGTLDLDMLGFPELNETRLAVANALQKLAGHPARCRTALGLSPRQDDEIRRNAELLTSPTMPAIARYTGVLYDALGAGDLSAAARRRAATTVIVCSALFGALRADDPVPAYRLSASNALPRLGTPTAIWRRQLADVLANDGAVIDLRSGAYQSLAPLPDAITVRVVSADGRSVSHFNKAAKGAFVRAFLGARRQPTTVVGAVTAATDAGMRVRCVGDDVIEITI